MGKYKSYAAERSRLYGQRHNAPILIISQVPPPHHGSTAMTETLIRVLNRSGYRTRLVDRRFSRSNNEIGQASIRKAISAIYLAARLIGAVVSFRPACCIFFVTTRSGSFVVDWALSEILRLLGVDVINYIHTQGFRKIAETGTTWSFLSRRLLGSARLTVCLGPSLVEDVSSLVRRDIVCIPNTSVGPGFESADKPAKNNMKRMIFLSNLMPSKGAAAFVKAAVVLSGRLPDVEFIIAGADTDTDYTESLRDMIRASRDAPRIHLVGPVYGKEKWDLLKSAALLGYPSEVDAQPLTVIEALSCGVPVVAYAVGGIPDLVIDNINGYLVENKNIEAFTEKCFQILNSDNLRRRLGYAAQISYSENYSEKVFESNWVKVLNGRKTPDSILRALEA